MRAGRRGISEIELASAGTARHDPVIKSGRGPRARPRPDCGGSPDAERPPRCCPGRPVSVGQDDAARSRCCSPAARRAAAAACATATRSAITRPRRAPARCRPRSTSPTRIFSAIPGRSSTAPARSSCSTRRSRRCWSPIPSSSSASPRSSAPSRSARCCDFLARHDIPHMLFINKLDAASARVRDVLAALQSVSERPLVLRQVPLRGGESEITGYVDLVSERAYRYRPGQASDLIPLPDGFWDQEGDTRTSLVEKLADFDDAAARTAARRRAAVEGGHLQAPDQGFSEEPDRAGVCRLGGAGLRRAPAVEGAAPRDAGAGRDRRAARHRAGRRTAGAGLQDLSPAAYRQAVAGAGLARLGGGRHRAERQCASPGSSSMLGGTAGEGAGRHIWARSSG